MKVPSAATQRTMRRIAHPRRTRRADARGLTVIDVIKAEMRKRRMTQQELAELAGVSEPCIFRFLAGKSKPKYETVERVLHCLGYELRTRKKKEDYSCKPEAGELVLSLQTQRKLS